MSFNSQVARTLDDEHRAHLSLLGRIEGALARRDDAALAPLAGPLVRQLEEEVLRHFGFEEQQLFPRMAETGDDAIAAMLTEEHDSMRAVAAELAPLARALAAGASPDRAALQRLALEWVERMVAHIQKETMALLPLLDDLLDEDSDRELSFAYSAG
ncbi:MAG: hemerythrin domain-containing protein [Rubrivivax sp.]